MQKAEQLSQPQHTWKSKNINGHSAQSVATAEYKQALRKMSVTNKISARYGATCRMVMIVNIKYKNI